VGDQRDAQVAVDRGVTVSREVLGGRRDVPVVLVAVDRGHREVGHELGVRGERAHADHGVRRVDVDVGVRAKFWLMPIARSSWPVMRAAVRVSTVLRSAPRAMLPANWVTGGHAGDQALLLVDPHEQRHPSTGTERGRLQPVGQRG